MQEEELDKRVLEKFGMPVEKNPELIAWKEFLSKYKNPERTVDVALVGKYVELQDAYKSIAESFIHAGAVNNCKVNLHWIHSENITRKNYEELLKPMKGVLVAPGFGHRGMEGKILAVKYARENNVPFFGVCLGMQCAVIEFARNVLGFEKANSSEMDEKTPYPVIDIMEEQKNVLEKGGTMRLGAYPCRIDKKSNAYKAYGETLIEERHRHRYEFNDKYFDDFKNAGMVPVGINPETNLVEIVEIPSHKWFVGVQFHPEYRSTVVKPHPLFVSFVKAVLE
jgi:CTP synthase